MPYRVSKSLKVREYVPFESIEEERNIIVDGGSLDPVDDGTLTRYVIPAGTPMAPIAATGYYWPVRRTTVAATLGNATTVTVADASPFKGDAGKGVLIFGSLSETAQLRTISSVDTTNNVIVITSPVTVTNGYYIEAALNGAHGNATAFNSAQIPDQVILKHDVEVLAADGSTTFHAPAVGVYRGAIRRDLLNGPSAAGYDDLLKSSHPTISFLPIKAGN